MCSSKYVQSNLGNVYYEIKEKLIDWKRCIPVAISGIIGAIFGAKISINMDVNYLKKYFGFFLILITIYEIYSLIKSNIKSKKVNNKNIN